MIDNHTARAEVESKQAEVIGAIMQYREEKLSFSELLMFLQTFDSTATVDDVLEILGCHYRGE